MILILCLLVVEYPIRDKYAAICTLPRETDICSRRYDNLALCENTREFQMTIEGLGEQD